MVVLLPTLNRIELVKQFFQSYKDTGADCAGYLLVDEADYKKNSKGYAEISAKYLPQDWILRNTKDAVSMGDKVRFVFPEIKHFKAVGLLNDDHYCVTREWDKKVERMLDGTNMVSTNDGNWNFGFNVVGLTAWSMGLLEACGFPIFPPGIDHWFIDNVWKAIGESTGCWLETMKVNIEHRHAFIGKMPQDETFKVSQNQEKAQSAMRAFEKFMKEDFKDVCARITAMRSKEIAKEKYV